MALKALETTSYAAYKLQVHNQSEEVKSFNSTKSKYKGTTNNQCTVKTGHWGTFRELTWWVL